MIGVNIGKLFNPSVQAGIGGGNKNYALQFDGSQNYAKINTLSSNLGTSAISFGGWFNIQANQPQSFPHFIALGNFDNGCIYFNTSAVKVSIKFTNIGGSTYDFGVDFTPYIGVRTHIVGVYNGAKISIYINGSEATFQNATGSITWSSDQCLVLGASDDNGGFSGAFAKEIVDEPFVYNTALTSTQINNIISTKTYPAGCLVRWMLNEGTGTSASDATGNGNTGTLVGSPLPAWVAGL